MIVKIINVILLINLFLICVFCKVDNIFCFKLGVLIIEVIMIIESDSIVV